MGVGKLKVSSFCSGIGSFEVAMKNLEIPHDIKFACEIDKYARETYTANHECETMYHDMTKEDYIGEHWYSDVNVSGIPCQAFSLAGKRLGELDPRGLLFYDFYRYVKNQQPKYFIIENVKGLLSDNDGNTFQNWINLLGQSVNGDPFMFPHEDSLMYNLHWQVLNTKDYGLPQNRERVFLIGIRNDLPNSFVFPKGVPLELRLKDILEDSVDEKYYLSEKFMDMLNNHAERHNEKGTGFAVQFKNEDDIANCLRANAAICPTDNILKIPTFGSDRLNKTLENNELKNGEIEFIDAYNQKIYSDGTTNTINTRVDASNHSFVKIPSATKSGYEIATEGDSINLEHPNSETRRGRVGKQVAQILTTSCNQGVMVVGFERTEEAKIKRSKSIKENGIDTGSFSDRQLILKDQDYSDTILANPNHQKEGLIAEIQVIGSTGGKNDHNSRIYGTDGISPTILAGNNGGGQSPVKHLTHDFRIRKLTPKECFRLQGFPDEFLQNAIDAGVSNSQLYKQAGNSITTNVIEAILKNLLKDYLPNGE